MNGSAQNYQPSPDLPTPHQEGLSPIVPEIASMPTMHAETDSIRAEMPAGGTPVNGVPAMPFGPAPTAPPPLTSSPSSAPVTHIPVNDAPMAADDHDLIEKEWVSKAKYIVETTREDPRLQNKQMSKFKADYIQKRYNKQLKVSDE